MAADDTGGNKPEETKTTTLRTFNSRDAAELAATKLEANGIECWVQSDDCSGMYPNLALARGVRLLVREPDAAAAAELLNEQSPLPDDLIQQTTDAPPEANVNVPWKIILPTFILGSVIGIVITMSVMGHNIGGTKTYYSYTSDGRACEGWFYRNGRLTEVTKDRNLDGHWDYWAYYEHGQLARADADNNFDGKVDEWWKFFNASADTLEKDSDFNGIPDMFCRYSNNLLRTVDVRPNDAKYTVTKQIYQNGVLAEVWRDGDSNGMFKEILKYDPFFNVTNTQFGDFLPPK